MDYMRVGTTFYKTVRRPLVSGDSICEYVTWSVECIKQDHDKSFIASIPKYDGFCFVPSQEHYQLDRWPCHQIIKIKLKIRRKNVLNNYFFF